MKYKTLNFGVYQNPLWQSMQHVVNHGTYHPGKSRRCCTHSARSQF